MSDVIRTRIRELILYELGDTDTRNGIEECVGDRIKLTEQEKEDLQKTVEAEADDAITTLKARWFPGPTNFTVDDLIEGLGRAAVMRLAGLAVLRHHKVLALLAPPHLTHLVESGDITTGHIRGVITTLFKDNEGKIALEEALKTIQ